MHLPLSSVAPENGTQDLFHGEFFTLRLFRRTLRWIYVSLFVMWAPAIPAWCASSAYAIIEVFRGALSIWRGYQVRAGLAIVVCRIFWRIVPAADLAVAPAQPCNLIPARCSPDHFLIDSAGRVVVSAGIMSFSTCDGG